MKKPRKVSYTIWLGNLTNRKDDKWITVKATCEDDARLVAEGKYDKNCFGISWVKKGSSKRVVGI